MLTLQIWRILSADWRVHLELCHRNPNTLKGPGTMLNQSHHPINYGEVRISASLTARTVESFDHQEKYFSPYRRTIEFQQLRLFIIFLNGNLSEACDWFQIYYKAGLQDFNEASFFTDPSRSSHQTCFIKKVFLKICDISEETLLKRACNFIKKKFKQRCFLVKCVKFLRTPILKNIYKRVLLPFLGFRKLNHNVFPFSFMETSLFCNNIINC